MARLDVALWQRLRGYAVPFEQDGKEGSVGPVESFAPSLAAAALLASVHVFSQRLRLLDGVPRSRLLSIAGGMAVAFVLLQLLPALAEGSQRLERAATGSLLEALRDHVYIVVLFSLVLFYGLERLAKQSRAQSTRSRREDVTSAPVFWLHTITFALMNALIGYLLLHNDARSTETLVLFTSAMTVKFVVNDHGLHADHKERYDRYGRWILAVAVLAGWLIRFSYQLPDLSPVLLQAFLAGGVLLNVLKEELPSERESRYWAFAAGATGYGVVLLFVA